MPTSEINYIPPGELKINPAIMFTTLEASAVVIALAAGCEACVPGGVRAVLCSTRAGDVDLFPQPDAEDLADRVLRALKCGELHMHLPPDEMRTSL